MAFGDAPIKAEGQRFRYDHGSKPATGMTANKPALERPAPKPHDGRRRHVKGFNKGMGE